MHYLRGSMISMIRVVQELIRTDCGSFVRVEELAEGVGISKSYAEQLMHSLIKAGVVESMRGPGGGYQLVNSEISLLQVLQAEDNFLDRNRRSLSEKVEKELELFNKSFRLWAAEQRIDEMTFSQEAA